MRFYSTKVLKKPHSNLCTPPSPIDTLHRVTVLACIFPNYLFNVYACSKRRYLSAGFNYYAKLRYYHSGITKCSGYSLTPALWEFVCFKTGQNRTEFTTRFWTHFFFIEQGLSIMGNSVRSKLPVLKSHREFQLNIWASLLGLSTFVEQSPSDENLISMLQFFPLSTTIRSCIV